MPAFWSCPGIYTLDFYALLGILLKALLAGKVVHGPGPVSKSPLSISSRRWKWPNDEYIWCTFSAPPWLGSLLPWLPLIPSPSCPSLLAKLALSSLLALLAGVLLLQVLFSYAHPQSPLATRSLLCPGNYPGKQRGTCCLVALGFLWVGHEGATNRIIWGTNFNLNLQNSLFERLLICWTMSSICWTTWCGCIRWLWSSIDVFIVFFYFLSIYFSCCCSPLLPHCTEHYEPKREKWGAGRGVRMTSRRKDFREISRRRDFQEISRTRGFQEISKRRDFQEIFKTRDWADEGEKGHPPLHLS